MLNVEDQISCLERISWRDREVLLCNGEGIVQTTNKIIVETPYVETNILAVKTVVVSIISWSSVQVGPVLLQFDAP